jgi:hypothetical protein
MDYADVFAKMNDMEKEQTEAHPRHVASVLRSDAAAWIAAITLWLYLGAILTTDGYLSVFRANPEWFDLSVFQLTSFSMFPLFGAALAATGYVMYVTSKGTGPKAIFGYLTWLLPSTLTTAFIFYSNNPYNLRRIESRWGRYGLGATVALFLIGPLVSQFWATRNRRRLLKQMDQTEVECKSSETKLDEAFEECGKLKALSDSFASNDPASARQALESFEAQNAQLLALRQRVEEIRASDARFRSNLGRATPREMWVAIALSAFITLFFCNTIGAAYAFLVTSSPPRGMNVATGVTEEILLTDGERSLSRKIVEGNEEIIYRTGDREWVVRMRDGSIPAPATRPTTSPATVPAQ